jgi:hypothetical protein
VFHGGSFGSPGGPGLRTGARRILDLSHSDRISDQDITVVGRTRGQVLVDARTERDQVLRNRVPGSWLFGAGSPPLDSSGSGGLRVWKIRSVQRGSGSSSSVPGDTKDGGWATSFVPGQAVNSERQKAHESSGCGGPRSAAVRISTESKALELRGIVTSWSSEQEHAMSKTA